MVPFVYTSYDSGVSKYVEVASRTAGMFMLGGVVRGHTHWAGFDAFKGVLYFGNGTVRILEESDLKSSHSAKAFFTDGGFAHISEVYSLRKLPVSKKRKRA